MRKDIKMVIKDLAGHARMHDVPEATKLCLDSCSQLLSPAQRSSYHRHVLVHRRGSWGGQIEMVFD